MGWQWNHIAVTVPTAVAVVTLAGIVVLLLRPRWDLTLALTGISLVVAANQYRAVRTRSSRPYDPPASAELETWD